MGEPVIGVIGGSGLYAMEALADPREVRVDTPWGEPSDALVTGRVHGVKVAFLARHGRQHHLLPSEVPFRANLHALKQLGARHVISLSAVGSLSENIRPLDLVLPDQFIDFTHQRPATFFGDGAVAHVSMARPVCAAVADALARAAQDVLAEPGEGALAGAPPALHRGGIYVCIEGPQYATQMESGWYRSLGGSVIGMTNATEAKLAREAQMGYATLALVTDFDCWRPRTAPVTAGMVLENLARSAQRAQRIAAGAIARLGREPPASEAHDALKDAWVTPWERVPPDTRQRLAVLLR